MATSNEANNSKYDVFISYSRRDYKDANNNVIEGSVISKIKERFQRAKISYWIDEDGISAGDAFAELISDKIESSAIFLFVATPNSIKSQWTKKEIKLAHDKQKHIIPFKCGDFSYPKGMDLLLADLDEINDYNKNQASALNKLVKSVMDVFPDRMQLSVGTDNSEIKRELVNLENRIDGLCAAVDKLIKEQYSAAEIGLITQQIVKQVLDTIEKRINISPLKETVVAETPMEATTEDTETEEHVYDGRVNLFLMIGNVGVTHNNLDVFNQAIKEVLYSLRLYAKKNNIILTISEIRVNGNVSVKPLQAVELFQWDNISHESKNRWDGGFKELERMIKETSYFDKQIVVVTGSSPRGINDFNFAGLSKRCQFLYISTFYSSNECSQYLPKFFRFAWGPLDIYKSVLREEVEKLLIQNIML